MIDNDGDALVIQVLANDPRFIPTEGIVIGTTATMPTPADLEALPSQLRDECGWGLGYE